MIHWQVTHKGDKRCRALADRHYSRQHPGSPMFCRPGYNFVLYTADDYGEGAWVWFRPKWESGIKGTERKDGLRAIECTLFRNETRILSSTLIKEAVALLDPWPHALGAEVSIPDGLISGVNSEKTRERRLRRSLPGKCFLDAGWEYFSHPVGVADIWLRTPFPVYAERNLTP